MKTFLKLSLVSLVLIAFNACGGSSKNNEEQPENNPKVHLKTATVYDDLLVNLSFKIKDTMGYTNEKGQFQYTQGEKVDFYLGDLQIGKITSLNKDGKVFLTDMLGLQRGDYTNPKLIKLARILQGLDTIPSDDKITLNKDTVQNIFQGKANTSLDSLDVSTLGISLPSKEQTQQRVKNTYKKENINPIEPKPEDTPAFTLNEAPIAKAGENQTVLEGTTVTLDASASSDNDGMIKKYEWRKDNQILSIEKNFSTIFDIGTHTITLTITDDKGAASSDSVIVVVNKHQDSTSPTVNIMPNDGSVDVPLDENINIKFSKEIDTQTIVKENITLTTNSVAVEYGKSQNQNTLILHPNNPLESETLYTITISNIKDKAGNLISPNPTIVHFTTMSAKKSLLQKYKEKGIDLSGWLGEIPVYTKVTTSTNGYPPFDVPSENKEYTGKTTIQLSENATQDKIFIKMSKNAFGLAEFLEWVFMNETILDTDEWNSQGQYAPPSPKVVLNALGEERVTKWKNKEYDFDVLVDNIQIHFDKNITFVKEKNTYDIYTDFLDPKREKNLAAIDFEYVFPLWDELANMAQGDANLTEKIKQGGSIHPGNYIGSSGILTDEWGENNFVEPKGIFDNNKMTFQFNIDHKDSGDYDKIEVTFTKQ